MPNTSTQSSRLPSSLGAVVVDRHCHVLGQVGLEVGTVVGVLLGTAGVGLDVVELDIDFAKHDAPSSTPKSCGA